jgi:hypothetical protein
LDAIEKKESGPVWLYLHKLERGAITADIREGFGDCQITEILEKNLGFDIKFETKEEAIRAVKRLPFVSS